MRTTVVVTMAGAGARFRGAGYVQPKFAIGVHSRPLIEWSLLSLSRFAAAGARAIFVARAADDPVAAIARACAAVGFANWTVVTLDKPTDGQATTVLAAEPALPDADDRLLVWNIDTHIRPDVLDPAEFAADGWLPCFPGTGDAWSFARADTAGRVAEVREKRRISPDATVGLYGFKSFRAFRDAYAATYPAGAPREAGECYVAPIYNALIAQRADVRLTRLPAQAVVPLGTPAEVEAFAAREIAA
jgi:dTDP-glucose pyrophosphorylase